MTGTGGSAPRKKPEEATPLVLGHWSLDSIHTQGAWHFSQRRDTGGRPGAICGGRSGAQHVASLRYWSRPRAPSVGSRRLPGVMGSPVCPGPWPLGAERFPTGVLCVCRNAGRARAVCASVSPGECARVGVNECPLCVHVAASVLRGVAHRSVCTYQRTLVGVCHINIFSGPLCAEKRVCKAKVPGSSPGLAGTAPLWSGWWGSHWGLRGEPHLLELLGG